MKGKSIPPSISKKEPLKPETFYLQSLEIQAIKLDKNSQQSKNQAIKNQIISASIQNQQNLRKNIQEERNGNADIIQEQNDNKVPLQRDNKLGVKYSKMPSNFELYRQETPPILNQQQLLPLNQNLATLMVKPNSQKAIPFHGKQGGNNEFISKKISQSSANSTTRSQTKDFISNQQLSLKNLNKPLKKPQSSQNSTQNLQNQQQNQISFEQYEKYQDTSFKQLDANIQIDENNQQHNGLFLDGQKLLCTKSIPPSAKESHSKLRKTYNNNNDTELQKQNKETGMLHLDPLKQQNIQITQIHKKLLPKLIVNEHLQAVNYNQLIDINSNTNNNNNNNSNNQQKIGKQYNSSIQLDKQNENRQQQISNKTNVQQVLQQNLNMVPLQKQYLIPNSLANISSKAKKQSFQDISGMLNTTNQQNGNSNSINSQDASTNLMYKIHKSCISPSKKSQNLHNVSLQKQSENQHSVIKEPSQSLDLEQDSNLPHKSNEPNQNHNSPNIYSSQEGMVKIGLNMVDNNQRENVKEEEYELKYDMQRKRKESDSKGMMTTSGSSTATNKRKNSKNFVVEHRQQQSDLQLSSSKQENQEKQGFQKFTGSSTETQQQQLKKPLFFESKQNESQKTKILSPTVNYQHKLQKQNSNLQKQNQINPINEGKSRDKKKPTIIAASQDDHKMKVKQEPLTIQEFELNEEFFRESLDGYYFDAEESLSGTWTGYTIQQYMKNQKEQNQQEKQQQSSAVKPKKKHSITSAKKNESNSSETKSIQKQAETNVKPQAMNKEFNTAGKQATKQIQGHNQEIEEDIQVEEN